MDRMCVCVFEDLKKRKKRIGKSTQVSRYYDDEDDNDDSCDDTESPFLSFLGFK